MLTIITEITVRAVGYDDYSHKYACYKNQFLNGDNFPDKYVPFIFIAVTPLHFVLDFMIRKMFPVVKQKFVKKVDEEKKVN